MCVYTRDSGSERARERECAALCEHSNDGDVGHMFIGFDFYGSRLGSSSRRNAKVLRLDAHGRLDRERRLSRYQTVRIAFARGDDVS
jgi:hypothetical protein